MLQIEVETVPTTEQHVQLQKLAIVTDSMY